MLRITTTEQDGHRKWILQGQLAGPWAAELKSNWEQAGCGGAKNRKCVVDLTEVTFVDEAGALVLCAMKNDGVRFIARGVDTKQLLEDLTRKTEPSLRRCLSWMASKEQPLKKEPLSKEPVWKEKDT
jgi:anti-anti-sigma regulatory factor